MYLIIQLLSNNFWIKNQVHTCHIALGQGKILSPISFFNPIELQIDFSIHFNSSNDHQNKIFQEPRVLLIFGQALRWGKFWSNHYLLKLIQSYLISSTYKHTQPFNLIKSCSHGFSPNFTLIHFMLILGSDTIVGFYD